MNTEDGGELQVDPEVEKEATTLGWAPKEKWRGAPEHWIDAQTFVERGHQVMPILQKNNQVLLGKLGEAQEAARLAQSTAEELRATVANLTTYQSAEVKRRVDAEVLKLKGERRAATVAGDSELAADLDEQLETAREEQRKLATAPTPAPRTPAPPPAKVEKWAEEFASENDDWFGPGKDRRKTALFAGIADDLFATKGLRGRELLDAAKAEMEETMGASRSTTGKAEGHQGGSGGRGGRSNGTGFTDLPAEAKAQCIADEKKFVGANKAFKTQAEWRAHYAKEYLSE